MLITDSQPSQLKQQHKCVALTSSGFCDQRCSIFNGKPAAFHSSTSGSTEAVPSDNDVCSQIARSAAASSGLAEACTPLSEPLGCVGRPRLCQRCRMSDRKLPARSMGSTAATNFSTG